MLLSLRPEQWTKNLIVFAALIFGQRLFDPAAVGRSLAAFFIFCALSGIVYLLNDVSAGGHPHARPGEHIVTRRRPDPIAPRSNHNLAATT